MQLITSIFFTAGIAIFCAYAGLAIIHALKFRYLSARSRKITTVFIVTSTITGATAISLFFSFNWV
ncbi:hypothetical protein KKG71_04860 [Patescibacteria group bacterium]|nr:hypothetical protein [Patescibacteria group bacterium]